MRAWALRVGFVSLLAVGLAGIPACGNKGGGSGKPKIAVVTNCTDPFWDLCEAGAKKAAQDFDVELLFRQPERLAAEVQKPIIDAWVSQGVSGIAVSVIDPKGQVEDLSLVSKKMPLLTMDNDADGCGRLCYVGVDNREAGRAVGRLVKKCIPNPGVIKMGLEARKNGIANVADISKSCTPNGTLPLLGIQS